jgi:lysophospholipase L1-like esterase
MCCPKRSLQIFLLLSATLVSSSALGQSFSIVSKGETNYWIEGSAPTDIPYVLQATANLHLWADLQSQLQGPFSLQLPQAGMSPRFASDVERFYRLTPAQPDAPPIRVVLIGDSMTADCCGWGGGIYGYFKPNATVVNYAAAFTSTPIFLTSAEKDKMLLLKPDYVLIQYGFVDQAYGPVVAPDRYTTLDQFATNLTTIVNMVRSFNGVPILVTLHAPRAWDANGKVIPSWQDRNGVTKAVAAQMKTPLIDLYQMTYDLFNELGPNGCDFMTWLPGDNMHLSPAGAVVVSQLVCSALPDALGPYLTNVFNPPAIPAPTGGQ